MKQGSFEYYLKFLIRVHPCESVAIFLVHSELARSTDLRDRLGAGLMPWWAPLLYIGIFLGVLLTVYLNAPPQPKNELDYWTSDKKPSEQASMMDT